MKKQTSINFTYDDDKVGAEVEALFYYLFGGDMFLPEVIEKILQDMEVAGDWSVDIVRDKNAAK